MRFLSHSVTCLNLSYSVSNDNLIWQAGSRLAGTECLKLNYKLRCVL